MEQHGYRRLREIGKGAFGQAVLCQDKEGKRFVAKHLDLTTMSRAERESCVNEVRVLRKLNHPNIVRYVDHFATQQALYIIMEYADSGDLGSMLTGRRAAFSEEEALHYLVQICLALKHLHDANILHRDLKAQNIFLAHKGRMVKLGDFGISTVLKSAGALAKTQCGTPFYFSPEMCQGLPYNAKSDMWSLGVLLYEMCTLRKPFQASNYKSLMTAICAGNPRPISETYSTELRGLLAILLHKDAAARPSASDVLRMDFVRRKMEQIVGDSIRVPHSATPPTAENPPTAPPAAPWQAPKYGIAAPVRMPPNQPPSGPVAAPKPNNNRMPGVAHNQQPQIPPHRPQQGLRPREERRREEGPAAPAKPTTDAQPTKQPMQAKADIKVNLHVSPYPRPPCMRLPSDARPAPTPDSCLPPSLLQGAARPTGASNLPPAPVPTAISEAVRRRMANVEGPSPVPQSFAPINPSVVRPQPTSHQQRHPHRWPPGAPPSVAVPGAPTTPTLPPAAIPPVSVPPAVGAPTTPTLPLATTPPVAIPPAVGAPTTPTIPPSRLPPAPFSVPTTAPRQMPAVVPPTTIVVTAPPRAALPVPQPAVKAIPSAECVVNSLPAAMTGDSPKKQFLEPVVPKPQGGLQGVPLILLSPMTAHRVLRDAEQFTEAALDRLEALGKSETEAPKEGNAESTTSTEVVEAEKLSSENVDESTNEVQKVEEKSDEKAVEEVDDEEVTDAVQSLTSESSAPSTRSSSVERAEVEPLTPTEVIATPSNEANEVVEVAEDAEEPLVTVATEEVEYGNMLHEIAGLLGVEGEGDVSTTWLPAESCTHCNMHRGECEEHAHEEQHEECTYEDAEAALDRLEALGKSESEAETAEQSRSQIDEETVSKTVAVDEAIEVVEAQANEHAVVEEAATLAKNESLTSEDFDFMTVSQLATATTTASTEADLVNQIVDALIVEGNADAKSVLDEEVDALAASISPSQTSQRSPSASNGGDSPSALSEADSSLNVSMYSDAGVVQQRRNPAGMLMWAAAAMAAPMALWYQVATLTA